MQAKAAFQSRWNVEAPPLYAAGSAMWQWCSEHHPSATKHQHAPANLLAESHHRMCAPDGA